MDLWAGLLFERKAAGGRRRPRPGVTTQFTCWPVARVHELGGMVLWPHSQVQEPETRSRIGVDTAEG
jgi:hypothetical protein